MYLTGTTRETTLGNTRLTTPREISVLSPGIDNNYSLSVSADIVTYESMTPNKK